MNLTRIPAILLTVVTLTPLLNAEVIRVPDDANTIAEGIAAASDGDTILISEGVYEGQGNFNLNVDRPLTFISESGPEGCVIDCGEAANSRGFLITARTRLRGLTITGATNCAIAVNNADSVFIENCIIRDNPGGQGQQSSGLDIRQSRGIAVQTIIEGNATPTSGGGLYFNGAFFELKNCIITGNAAARFGGGALITGRSTVDVINCLFIENSAGIDGGALAYSVESRGLVYNCNLLGNQAGVADGVDNGGGGGIYVGSNSLPVVRDCIFWGNEADAAPQIFIQVDREGGIDISHTCVEGGVDEEGNWDGEEIIAEEPDFTDGPESIWGPNEFFLSEESPCIDAGSVEAADSRVAGMSTRPDLHDDADAVDIGFHYDFRWFELFGRIFGVVSASLDDQPIAGALVTTSRGQSALTDEEGAWEIDPAYALPTVISVAAQWFNPAVTEPFDLELDGEAEVNIQLQQPLMEVDRDELAGRLNVDDTTTVTFVLSNPGDGALNWSGSAQLLEEFLHELWTLRGALPLGRAVQDDRIYGAVLTDDLYYVSGADDDEPNTIYVFNRDGEFQRQFNQPGESRYGMRDLAWDGTLLWGSGEANIYGFTTDGDVEAEFRGANNPIYGITWDSQRGLIWCCSVSSEFVAFDRDGNRVTQAANPDLRVYGLAFNPNDPDEMPLYILHDTGEAPRQAVYKINTVTGEGMAAAVLPDSSNARPGGAFITMEYDPYSVVMLSVPNGQSRVDVWQVDRNDRWLWIEPREGIVQGGEEIEITLTLTSTGFSDGVYEGEVVIDHTADPGRTVLPVVMEVSEGPVHTVRNLNLPMGWSLASVDLQPDERDVTVLTRALVEAGVLLMMKDQHGHFYLPARDGFNNIEGWSVEQSYWIKCSQNSRLALEGTTVRADEPIELQAGWQNVAYYPRMALSAPQAFIGLGDNLRIAKDGMGGFYSPAYQFNSIGRCQPGAGFQVRVQEAGEFVWNAGRDGIDRYEASPAPSLAHFSPPHRTPVSHSVLVLAAGAQEAALFCSDRLVGAAAFISDKAGVTVWGDDPASSALDGAVLGEEFSLVLWSPESGERQVEMELLEGTVTFEENGWTVARARDFTPSGIALVSAYPNPFNDRTAVSIHLAEGGYTTLTAYDVTGRVVQQFLADRLPSGQHRIVWDAGGLPSGIYFIEAASSASFGASRTLIARTKVALLR